jgi:protein-tyrosine phosphatase
MPLTELPYGLPGRVFRSQMPYSSYDPRGELVEQYLSDGIEAIVLLVRDEESRDITQRELKKLYAERGFKVVHLPIKDFGIPDPEELRQAVKEAHQLAREGKNLVIHCHAGIGRTGMFAACLAMETLGLSGERAIDWAKEQIPDAVETREQRFAVLRYQPDEV